MSASVPPGELPAAAPVRWPGRVWIDGQVIDVAEARVPLLDRGFLYGDSVYEVLRTFHQVPHALGEHLDRLEGSARRIGMALPPRALIEGATARVIQSTGEPECYLRIIVTRGVTREVIRGATPGVNQGLTPGVRPAVERSGAASAAAFPLDLDPASAGEPRLVVIALRLRLPDPGLYQRGASLALVGARRNAQGSLDPMVKSGNYLNSVLAVAEARRKGAYEALMCDGVGRIAEGASSNLFVVRGDRIATPPLSVGLLEGITRRRAIRLARGLGIPVDEVGLWPRDLESAEEAFITSSVRGVMPIVRVDEQAVGEGRPGPITCRVMAAYAEDCEGPPAAG